MTRAQDLRDFTLVKAVFLARGKYQRGSRGIYMKFCHDGIAMSRKKIVRLMRKYGLACHIRQANPYRRMIKALATDDVAKNLVNREFEKYGPGKIILTDITHIFYNHGKCLYLSVMKDGFTKQEMAHEQSVSLEEDFVLATVLQLKERHGDDLAEDPWVHSDQGGHYTSVRFSKLISDSGLTRSMSRKANCWDNAPQESFFGHMKDEIDLSGCKNPEDVRIVIDDYMDYYNNDRYQEHLGGLSPNEFANFIKTGINPLKIRFSRKKSLMKGLNTPGQALERGGVAPFPEPRGSRISPCFPGTRSVREPW
ncbi:MAG: IS3 family transposase [Sphaerochaeta sp.]|nr:IS3 family transposase [Sphaerochaeta sp.]